MYVLYSLFLNLQSMMSSENGIIWGVSMPMKWGSRSMWRVAWIWMMCMFPDGVTWSLWNS